MEDEAYADGRIARRAIERLRALKERPDRPFFLAIGFARPHLPFSVPLKYWDMYDPETLPMPDRETGPEGAPEYAVKRDGEIVQYDPIPHSSEADPFPPELTRKLIHGYYASTSYVDAQIGKVIAELEDLGLADNTIIVLWGDHGFHLDIYPTLVELAGLPPPETSQPMDGVSLVPVLADPAVRVRDYSYHCFPRGGRMGRAIRTADHRLVEWKEIGAARETADIELYEYSGGLVETRNIAAQRPDVVARLRAILDQQPEARPARPLSRR